MDHETSVKNPDEFFNKCMFIDLNSQLCQHKQDNMFEWEIIDNYAAHILDAKWEQVDTRKVAIDPTHLYMSPPRTCPE